VTIRQGGVVLPLVASTGNTLLQDADPALFYALAFVRFLIEHHVGARLVSEATICGAPIAAAVANSIPFDPSPYLTEDQLRFPLLAVYRQSSESVSRSEMWTQSNGTLAINYVLPPLTAGQAERLLPVFHACSAMLARALQLGANAGYTPPGGAAGDPVWKLASIEKVELGAEKYGVWSDGGDLVFHTWSAELRISERTAYSFSATGDPLATATQDFQPLADIEIHEDILDTETGATVADIVVIRTVP
jgi:hypothetical protein